MTTTSIRIESKTHAKLAALAKREQSSMARIVADAVDEYEDERFWRAAQKGYERLNADADDRASFDADVSAWTPALSDGLSGFPYDE